MTPRSPLYPPEVLADRDARLDGRVNRARSTASMLLDSLRHRPVPRRILNALSIVMLLVGIGFFAWPFATNLWSDYKQASLEDDFGSASHRRAYLTRTIPPGEALTRLVIPALGVDTIVVEGTTLSALEAGSGHYSGTALPCEGGNSAIAGHRTTYGKPFANVDDLEPGDRIKLVTPIGECVYEVSVEPWITHPGDFTVLEQPRSGSFLTLTTCHPPGSAEERLIVRARLVSSRLFAA